jgi:hypothetical protein
LRAERQLAEYSADTRKSFDLRSIFPGRLFRSRLVRAPQVPIRAQTRTYGEIAIAIGNRRAFLAVCAANVTFRSQSSRRAIRHRKGRLAHGVRRRARGKECLLGVETI